MADDKQKSENDGQGSVSDNFKKFSEVIKNSENVLRYKMNRLARFRPGENLLGYQPKSRRGFLDFKYYRRNRVGTLRNTSNFIRSMYRTYLSWDISDEKNAVKIRESMASKLLTEQVRRVEALEENNIFKQYKSGRKLYIHIIDKSFKVKERLKRLKFRNPRNHFKKLQSLQNSMELSNAFKEVASLKVLRRMNQFGNYASVLNFLIRDRSEDKKDKLNYYSNEAGAFKGGFDIIRDFRFVKNLGRRISTSIPKTATALKYVGGFGSRAVGVLSFAADISKVYKAKTDKAKAQKLGEALGGPGGAFLGAKAGAAIGTLVGGPVGTVIGGVVGGAAGYLIGSGIGAKIATRFKKEIMTVWKPIEKYTRVQFNSMKNFTEKSVFKPMQSLTRTGIKSVKNFWNKNKQTIIKYAAGAGTALLTGGPLGLSGYIGGKLVESLLPKKYQKGIIKPLVGSLTSLSGGLSGLLGYGTGTITENLMISQKQKKPLPTIKSSSINKTREQLTGTNSISHHQVLTQMISELNKVMQNKVISHRVSYT